MTTMIVNLNDGTVVEAQGCVVVDWQGFEGETPEDVVSYAEHHGRPLIIKPDLLATKRWSRDDFAARLDERIESGELDISPVYAKMIVDSITKHDASILNQADEHDWFDIDLILDAVIERAPGNG